MPFAAEVAAAIISLVIITLSTIAYRVVKGDGQPTTTLPSDRGPDLSAVLAAVENLKARIDQLDATEKRRLDSHEGASQQRMDSLIRCLERDREQQEIEDRFKALEAKLERLRNGKV